MSTNGLNNGLNEHKAEAFAERMLDILNSGALALMTSIGHRTKLFDTMAILPPATSGQIAEAAGLNERYVREWLGAMVTGQIIQYNPDEETYHLPAEHAAWLTRAAMPDNLALFAQNIGLLGSVEDDAVHNLLHALHDGLPGAGRRGSWHHVGRRKSAGDVSRGRLHRGRGETTAPRLCE